MSENLSFFQCCQRYALPYVILKSATCQDRFLFKMDVPDCYYEHIFKNFCVPEFFINFFPNPTIVIIYTKQHDA